MTFLAKSDYFTGRGLKGRMTAAFFRGVGQLPVDRSGGRAGEAALRSGLKVLRRGELLGIYPEGTRSPDGRLYRGRTGVARMALEGSVKVLPVAMIGTDKAQPTGTKIPKLIRIGVKIGKPLDFSRYEGMEDDRFVLRSITDEIMYELMLLSGQEYVDMYATSMKDRILAAAKTKARELQEAALPGSAAKELEEALDAGDDETIAQGAPQRRRRRRRHRRGHRERRRQLARPRAGRASRTASGSTPPTRPARCPRAPARRAEDPFAVARHLSLSARRAIAAPDSQPEVVSAFWKGIDVFRPLALAYAAYSLADRPHDLVAPRPGLGGPRPCSASGPSSWSSTGGAGSGWSWSSCCSPPQRSWPPSWSTRPRRSRQGSRTLPTIWPAAGVVSAAVLLGRKGGLAAAVFIGIVDVVEVGKATPNTINNIVLLLLIGTLIGYACDLAREGHAKLREALALEAQVRERERLARTVHDGVLQTLAFINRRGTQLGGRGGRAGRAWRPTRNACCAPSSAARRRPTPRPP